MLYGSVAQCKVLPARGADCAALIRYQTVAEAQWVKENLDGNIPQGMQSPVNIKYKAGPGAKGGGKGGDFGAPQAAWGAAVDNSAGGWDRSAPYGGDNVSQGGKGCGSAGGGGGGGKGAGAAIAN